MSRIEWSDTYSINNLVIDTQHKKLFSILNRLSDGLTNNIDDRGYLIAVERLWSYVNYHFSEEERLMAEVGYSEIYRHTLQHRLFTNKIMQLKGLMESDSREPARDLTVFLGNWILHHVLEEDKKIMPQ
jgi:hemerythrin